MSPMRWFDRGLALAGVGALGRNTVLTTAGFGARALIQAGYLILLSRHLGPGDYGLFSALVALAVVASPLAGWGATFLYAQRVSREPRAAPAMWAATLVQVLGTGAVLALGVLALSAFGLRVTLPWPCVLAIAVAELVALPLALAAGRAFLVADAPGPAAFCMTVVPLGRLLALAGLLLAGVEAAGTRVAWTHLLGSLAGCVAALTLFHRAAGGPAWRERPAAGPLLARGTAFALGAGAGVSYPEVDKPLLLQLLGAVAAGLYSVAFRVVNLFTLPVSALVAAATPRLFAARDASTRARILRHVTRAALAYALVSAAACWFASGLIPAVFGAEFGASRALVGWLLPWLPLYALHQCLALGLTCGGRQKARAVIEGCGLVLVLALDAWLLPTAGPRAAAWSLVAAEVFMAGACVLARPPRSA